MLLKRVKGGERKRKGNLLLFSIFPIKLVLRKIFPRVRLQAIVPWNWVQPATVNCVKCVEKGVLCCDEKPVISPQKREKSFLFHPKKRISPSTNLNCEFFVTHNKDTSTAKKPLEKIFASPSPNFFSPFPNTGYYQSWVNVIITFHDESKTFTTISLLPISFPPLVRTLSCSKSVVLFPCLNHFHWDFFSLIFLAFHPPQFFPHDVSWRFSFGMESTFMMKNTIHSYCYFCV